MFNTNILVAGHKGAGKTFAVVRYIGGDATSPVYQVLQRPADHYNLVLLLDPIGELRRYFPQFPVVPECSQVNHKYTILQPQPGFSLYRLYLWYEALRNVGWTDTNRTLLVIDEVDRLLPHTAPVRDTWILSYSRNFNIDIVMTTKRVKMIHTNVIQNIDFLILGKYNRPQDLLDTRLLDRTQIHKIPIQKHKFVIIEV